MSRLLLALLPALSLACSDKGSTEQPVCPEDIVAVVDGLEWTDLSGALGSASQGRYLEVDVCPGTFPTAVEVDPPDNGWDRIVLRGHPDGSVLEGNGREPVLFFRGAGTVELIDLTITGGASPGGGGGYRGNGAQLLILDGVTFEGNQAAKSGGAVRMLGEGDEPVQLEDGGSGGTRFIDNHAGEAGGAVSLVSGSFAALSPGGWELDGNSAGTHGGALHVGSDQTVSFFGDVVATGNQAAERGGVLAVTAPDATGLVLGRVDATDNRAGTEGGVVSLAGGAGDLTVQSGSIVGNTASGGGALAASNGYTVSASQIEALDNAPDDVLYAGESYLGAALGSAFVCAPDSGCVAAR